MMSQPSLFPEKRRRKPPPAIERRTQIAIVDLLRKAAVPGWFFTHLPSGEFRSESTGKLLRRMGLQRGLPDLMLISPVGQCCFLELKRGTRGRLTPDQVDFGELCRNCGIPYALVRSFDEAVAQLAAWGVLKPGLHWQ